MEDKAKQVKYILYRDKKYGFSLLIPYWWKKYIVVKFEKNLYEAEYGVSFYFKYKGKVYDEVLTIAVYRMTRKQWKDKGYDESPVVLIAQRAGRMYAYTVPGELPHEFLNKSEDDYDYKKFGTPIRLLKRMVNHDVPKIVKTLQFTGKAGSP